MFFDILLIQVLPYHIIIKYKYEIIRGYKSAIIQWFWMKMFQYILSTVCGNRHTNNLQTSKYHTCLKERETRIYTIHYLEESPIQPTPCSRMDFIPKFCFVCKICHYVIISEIIYRNNIFFSHVLRNVESSYWMIHMPIMTS